jgi:hypothetical protein
MMEVDVDCGEESVSDLDLDPDAIAIVPEPTASGLAASALAALLVCSSRRRRTRSNPKVQEPARDSTRRASTPALAGESRVRLPC